MSFFAIEVSDERLRFPSEKHELPVARWCISAFALLLREMRFNVTTQQSIMTSTARKARLIFTWVCNTCLRPAKQRQTSSTHKDKTKGEVFPSISSLKVQRKMLLSSSPPSERVEFNKDHLTSERDELKKERGTERHGFNPKEHRYNVTQLYFVNCCSNTVYMLASAVDPTCKLREKFNPGIFQDGDVILGGLFPMHLRAAPDYNSFRSKPQPVRFVEFSQRGLRWAQTMVFAIEEINRNPELLPNITLGYKIFDSCDAPSEGLKGAFKLLKEKDGSVSNYTCAGVPSVSMIVGDGGSSQSIVVSRVVAPFGIGMVSYFSSCACLSDKREFPTFFRTIPTDTVQMKALVRLIRYFEWTWIGAVAEDNDYGRFGMRSLIEEVAKFEICIAYIEFLSPGRTRERMRQIAKTIKKSSAKVIIIFCGESDTMSLITEFRMQNITDIQLIASEAWVTSFQMWSVETLEILSGTIGFGIRRAEIPGLREFLVKLHPSTAADDPFVEELWREVFGCSVKISNQIPGENISAFPHRPCTGLESLETIESTYTDVSQLRVSYNVYKAVYAGAHALHNLQSCENGKGPFSNKTCGQKSNIQPQQLLQYLRKVRFTNQFGEEISFDQDGDPIASYDLINWQKRPDGSVEFVQVGSYDAALPAGEELALDESEIIWHGTGLEKKVPVSTCSDSCFAGTRRTVRKGQPVCCFDCFPCADGEISNQTDSIECIKCPTDYWPNDPRNQCILKEIEFLSFQDSMGVTLMTISLFGACITGAVAAVFLHFINTPIVRANNSELSFLLLISLILCFLCSIAFIGQPTPWSCIVRHTVFGVSFALSTSCILSKTLVVLMAFKATLPASNVMKWFGPKQQRSIVFLCTLIQIIICVIWLVTSPPLPAKNIKYQSAKIILECDVGSTVAFCCVFGYIGLLACTCLILAFLARALPDKFNEAKFITFSMLIFFVVWVTFIPAYVSTPGKYTDVVEIFAILASSFGLLSCIFAPKCYIILFKPEKNTKKHLIGKNVQT
ncbi:extracellular calcium-sensing receptor-like [Heterodontus francisci]|uniref:extracellular calcium-sensing receptor-like n=1 Tax=Heterodontus francisci TaxID=7792 RepID=UPI00355B774C